MRVSFWWLNIPNAPPTITRSPTAAHLSPFFLREHSKRILRGALNSDSKFLADINVMDYSFVVGVDSVKNELVVGIVGEWFHRRVVVYSVVTGWIRLREDLYMGQKTGKLGQRVRVPRGSG